jgi:protein SCO1/2
VLPPEVTRVQRCKAIAAGLLLAALLAGCGKSPELPRVAQVPAFELRDQDGARVTRESLRGRVWVANFMFTSCPDVCPILTAKMAGVRTRLVGDRVPVRIVSFTVDPQTDTPEVLKQYARERSADFEDWRFLTGPLDEIKRVIVEGFKQGMSPQPAQAGQPQSILHGSHFVLVDADLYIRGYYASDGDGLLRLARDARILAERPEG